MSPNATYSIMKSQYSSIKHAILYLPPQKKKKKKKKEFQLKLSIFKVKEFLYDTKLLNWVKNINTLPSLILNPFHHHDLCYRSINMGNHLF